MRFDPISEKEADSQSSGLWTDGDYEYEIKEATEEESKSGNEMIKLEVWFFNPAGQRRMVFDYLVSIDSVQWKIRHFAESCGLVEQYEGGTLMASEIVGRTGRCKLGTQKATDDYPAKNVIRDYIKAKGAPAVRQKAPVGAGAGTDLDDEIPFAAEWR